MSDIKAWLIDNYIKKLWNKDVENVHQRLVLDLYTILVNSSKWVSGLENLF